MGNSYKINSKGETVDQYGRKFEFDRPKKGQRYPKRKKIAFVKLINPQEVADELDY